MALAVIKTGGKQYVVKQGMRLKVEKIPGDVGTEVSFTDVLLFADGDTVNIGTPALPGASVSGKVLAQARADKKLIFKFKSKTGERRKKGHRQYYTEVEITDIKV